MTRIEEIIQYESESHLVDFKLLPYDLRDKFKKHEFLKDVSSMANGLSSEDKYIIVGVDEKDGVASGFQNINQLDDQAKFQQYLDSNIEPSINFEYKPYTYREYKLAYFRIYNNKDKPYLFKGDVTINNPRPMIKYRKGDGYIRAGTSTRRLTRSDYDNIYKRKFAEVDRKSDLEISFIIDKAEEGLNINNARYFDLKIENKSSKSIGFDIQMRVFFEEIKTVRSRKSIKETMIIQKSGSLFGIESIYIPTLPNFDVYIEEKEDYLYIERTTRNNEEYAVRIPQKSYVEDVFFQELILTSVDNFTLKAEVTIRSDDFKDGPLIFEIEEEVQSA